MDQSRKDVLDTRARTGAPEAQIGGRASQIPRMAWPLQRKVHGRKQQCSEHVMEDRLEGHVLIREHGVV